MKNLKVNKTCNGVYYFRPHLLKFPVYSDYISDNDICDLFMGLMNLIKRSAELKCEEKYMSEIMLLKNEIKLIKSRK